MGKYACTQTNFFNQHYYLIFFLYYSEIFVRKAVNDRKRRSFQEFVLDVHNMKMIGPRQVFTKPVRLLTSTLDDVPVGLTFLETFLSSPMEFLVE